MLGSVISPRIVHLGVNFTEKHLTLGTICMLVMCGNRLFQATNLGPVRSLHQERCDGQTPTTSPIVTCLGLAIL
jgi:hypothetical protein